MFNNHIHPQIVGGGVSKKQPKLMALKDREQVVILRNYYDKLKEITPSRELQKGLALEILEYAFEGKIPEKPSTDMFIFTRYMQVIDEQFGVRRPTNFYDEMAKKHDFPPKKK